jgi:hypothetical protein
MAKVIEKRPDGAAIVVVPATDVVDLEVGASVDVRPAAVAETLPWPFGALAGKYPPFEFEEVKASRREMAHMALGRQVPYSHQIP